MRRCTFVLIFCLLFLQVSCTDGLLNTRTIFNRYRILLSTANGLAISSDRGQSFALRTQANSGLAQDTPVYAVGSGDDIYAAFNSYISVSNNGGVTFVSYLNGTNGLAGGPFDSANNGGWINTNGKVFLSNDDGFITSTNHGASFTSITPVIEVCGAFSGSGSLVILGNTGGTAPGVYISTDGGNTFPTYKTTADGLPSNYIYGTAYNGSAIFATGPSGLGVSYDGGVSFSAKTTTDGLGSNSTVMVVTNGSSVYVATAGGVSISTNNGVSFSNKTTANGLPSNNIVGVAVTTDQYIYAATDNGLAVSTDSGQTFTTINTSAYFPSNAIYSMSISYY